MGAKWWVTAVGVYEVAVHGSWRGMEGVVDGMPMHGKLLQASTEGVLVHAICFRYRTQWPAKDSVFGAIGLCFFVCVWNISGAAE